MSERRRINLAVGERIILEAESAGTELATIRAAYGTRWESSDSSVATLDRLDGPRIVVTAKAPGRCLITARHAVTREAIEHLPHEQRLWEQQPSRTHAVDAYAVAVGTRPIVKEVQSEETDSVEVCVYPVDRPGRLGILVIQVGQRIYTHE